MKNYSKHYQKRISELKAENARLKAEVERLRASSFVTAVPVEEYEKLKAEVERLQNNCNHLDRELDREIDKTAMLCGQIERLRKAGDAMAHRLLLWHDDDYSCTWNDAKDGKPTE